MECSGGDADQLEEEYHHLAGRDNSQEVDSPIQSNYHSSLQAMSSIPANNSDSSIQVGLELKNRMYAPPVEGVVPTTFSSTQNNQTVVLTAEQRAMIEAKRLEALRRRQLKMQAMQQKSSSAPPINPYAKK